MHLLRKENVSLRHHTKLYLTAFGYDNSDFVACEVCGAKAQDVHHINSRGMGGSTQADRIENLQALCRKHHTDYGDKKEFTAWLFRVHVITMEEGGVKFDRQWIEGQLQKYA